MIYLELVGSKYEQRARTYGSSDLLEGTTVALRLTHPWHSSGRVVVADCHFASLKLAEELYRRGIRFLGVIKNNTTGFPKEWLSTTALQGSPGEFKMLVHDPETPNFPRVGAVVWVVRARRFYIGTCSNARLGLPMTRHRWSQGAEESIREMIFIPEPRLLQHFHDAAGAMNRNNRTRQSDLGGEISLLTHDWE